MTYREETLKRYRNYLIHKGYSEADVNVSLMILGTGFDFGTLNNSDEVAQQKMLDGVFEEIVIH